MNNQLELFNLLLSNEITVKKIKKHFIAKMLKMFTYNASVEDIEDTFQNTIILCYNTFSKPENKLKDYGFDNPTNIKNYLYRSLYYNFKMMVKKDANKNKKFSKYKQSPEIKTVKEMLSQKNDFIVVEDEKELSDLEKLNIIEEYVKQNCDKFEYQTYMFRTKSQMSYKAMSEYSGFSISKMESTYEKVCLKIRKDLQYLYKTK